MRLSVYGDEGHIVSSGLFIYILHIRRLNQMLSVCDFFSIYIFRVQWTSDPILYTQKYMERDAKKLRRRARRTSFIVHVRSNLSDHVHNKNPSLYIHKTCVVL